MLIHSHGIRALLVPCFNMGGVSCSGRLRVLARWTLRRPDRYQLVAPRMLPGVWGTRPADAKMWEALASRGTPVRALGSCALLTRFGDEVQCGG